MFSRFIITYLIYLNISIVCPKEQSYTWSRWILENQICSSFPVLLQHQQEKDPIRKFFMACLHQNSYWWKKTKLLLTRAHVVLFIMLTQNHLKPDLHPTQSHYPSLIHLKCSKITRKAYLFSFKCQFHQILQTKSLFSHLIQ